MLDRLRDWWGGTVYPHNKGGNLECYEWKISGSRCRYFANKIFGLVSEKRQSELIRLFPEVI